jgi:hypothetical protein
MGRNHLCEQAIPEDPAHLLQGTCAPRRPSGLSLGFPRLSPSRRQLDYVLLARPPRYSPCGFHVRLACLIHAANVRSEPGSNPSLELLVPWRRSRPSEDGQDGFAGLHHRSRGSRSSHFKKAHTLFFRGHPECQRSPRRRRCRAARGGRK